MTEYNPKTNDDENLLLASILVSLNSEPPFFFRGAVLLYLFLN